MTVTKASTYTASLILKGMVLSLVDSGFKPQDVVAALDKLADQGRRDGWQKAMESRERSGFGPRT
jgi:hypothetical protein